MDVPLTQLAAVSADLGRAEEACEEEAWTTARAALDDVDRGLDELRDVYRELGERERAALGAIAGPLRRRRDAVAGRIPRPQAVSEGAPVHDPEQDDEAAEAPAGGAPAAAPPSRDPQFSEGSSGA